MLIDKAGPREAGGVKSDEIKNHEAYLGRNVRLVPATSSMPQSSSAYLNNPMIRELLPIWLLRRNGADFPIEADHTIGLLAAFEQVVSPEELAALFDEELAINPRLARWVDERHTPTWRNEDFQAFAPGTIGGIIGEQVRDHGFDVTLGMGPMPANLAPYDYYQRMSRLTHDFLHLVTGGPFTFGGEIVVIMANISNKSRHMSPKLVGPMNAYGLFSALRMVTRSLLHYPETFHVALRGMQQGIDVGLNSPPFWEFHWEDVLDKTPAEARRHFGMPEVDFLESTYEEEIFRERIVA